MQHLEVQLLVAIQVCWHCFGVEWFFGWQLEINDQQLPQPCMLPRAKMASAKLTCEGKQASSRLCERSSHVFTDRVTPLRFCKQIEVPNCA